ncbi:MAG: alkaline shock response membrane anchor protein AmaP [Bacillota bacterium]
MNVIRKTMGIISSMLLMIVAFGAMIIFARNDIDKLLRRFFETEILVNPQMRLYFLMGAWGIFVLAFATLILFSIRNNGVRGISRRNDFGEFNVSLHAIENIALAEARRISGLKVLKTPVRKSDKGIFVTVKASIMMDENIPEISKAIQERVKVAIEKSTEIDVVEVKVHISDIFVPNKPRVE